MFWNSLGEYLPFRTDAAVTVTGVAASPAVGSPLEAADDTVSVTGVGASPAVGTVTVAAASSVSATGVAAAPAVGSATPLGLRSSTGGFASFPKAIRRAARFWAGPRFAPPPELVHSVPTDAVASARETTANMPRPAVGIVRARGDAHVTVTGVRAFCATGVVSGWGVHNPTEAELTRIVLMLLEDAA